MHPILGELCCTLLHTITPWQRQNLKNTSKKKSFKRQLVEQSRPSPSTLSHTLPSNQPFVRSVRLRLHNTVARIYDRAHTLHAQRCFYISQQNQFFPFPLKMHLMVLESNQLIRRLELSPLAVSVNALQKKERTGARGGVVKLSMLVDGHSLPVKCQPLPQY